MCFTVVAAEFELHLCRFGKSDQGDAYFSVWLGESSPCQETAAVNEDVLASMMFVKMRNIKVVDCMFRSCFHAQKFSNTSFSSRRTTVDFSSFIGMQTRR